MAAKKKKKKRTTKKKVAHKVSSKTARDRGTDAASLEDDCVEAAATMLARRVNNATIRRVISLKVYGGKPEAQAVPMKLISLLDLQRFVKAATDRALKTYQRDKDQQKALAVATYEEVIRDPDSKPADRINAQRRIDDLMGHDYRTSGDRLTPEEQAQAVIEAVRAMRATVPKVGS